MFLPSVYMICMPSGSSVISPAFMPWISFQYLEETIRSSEIVKYLLSASSADVDPALLEETTPAAGFSLRSDVSPMHHSVLLRPRTEPHKCSPFHFCFRLTSVLSLSYKLLFFSDFFTINGTAACKAHTHSADRSGDELIEKRINRAMLIATAFQNKKAPGWLSSDASSTLSVVRSAHPPRLRRGNSIFVYCMGYSSISSLRL